MQAFFLFDSRLYFLKYAIIVYIQKNGVFIMYREEAVALMCDTINKMNRQMARDANMPKDQIESFIEQGKEQLLHVNGLLYDTLRDHGVIA